MADKKLIAEWKKVYKEFCKVECAVKHDCDKDDRKLPIDRPCSACSAGDTRMEYHDHCPPFRLASRNPAWNAELGGQLLEEVEKDIQEPQPTRKFRKVL